MKKHFHFLAAVAALMTCACSVEPVDVVDVQPEEDGEFTVLTAGFAGVEDETRTVRQADGKVFWSPGDAISIIRGTSSSGHKRFVADNTEPSPMAAFSGTMPSGSSAYWAVYPYKADDSYNGTYFITTLPAQQEAVAGSFADELFISAAYVRNSTTTLSFYHQCGGIKFTLTQPGIKKVTLIPADSEVFLAGLIGLYATSAGSAPYIRATGSPEDMSNTIELSAPAGQALEVGAAYHFVTMPAYLAGGFTLFFEKEDGSIAFRTIDKDVTIQAAHFVSVKEVDKGLAFKKDYLDFRPDAVSVDGLGGVFAIDVKGTLDYHIDSSSDWIREVAATGDVRINRRHAFLADRNETGAERMGMLTICYGDNCYPILVTQGAMGGLKILPHHILGMRFTATWCQYCPIMDANFRYAREQLGDGFEYVCIYDSGGNYSFSGSDELGAVYRISSWPSGIIDGRFRLENYSNPSYALQVLTTADKETVTYYPTATAIGLSSTLSGRNLAVDVDVKAQYDEDYKLTVFLCENNIIGNQSHYEQGIVTNFNHSRVTRMSLTAATGDVVSCPSDGTTKTFRFTATIPSGYKTENMEVVAFIQRNYGDRPALQSGKYGEWYVDNCRAAALGATAPLEVQ